MVSPVQKLRSLDAEWDAKASQAAIDGAREATESINPRAAISSLSSTEWMWIAMGAVFGWIKTKSQHAIAESKSFDKTIREMPQYFPEPWDAGAVESILPKLGDLKGMPWDKPLGDWSTKEMVRLAWNMHYLIDGAIARREEGAEGKIVTIKSQAVVEREMSARQGGPLWDRKEYADDDIPF